MPHDIKTRAASVYIPREFWSDWDKAEKLAAKLYGPRGLSRYVNEAVRARNEREGGE